MPQELQALTVAQALGWVGESCSFLEEVTGGTEEGQADQ